MPTLLEVRGLGLAFGAFTALADLDLDLDAGEALAVIGPNGAGKTSLLDCLCGLVRPTAGVVRFEGQDLHSLDTTAIARAGVSRTFQEGRLFRSLDIVTNVALAVPVAGGILTALPGRREAREARARAMDALGALGLDPWASRNAQTLPWAEAKAVSLARVLAARPRLALLDEPFAGLSAQERGDLASRFFDAIAASGSALIVVEHDHETASRLASSALGLEAGRVVARGGMDSVREALAGGACR